VITKIDGKDISSGTELRSALYSKSVGDTIEVTFYREDKEQTVKVELSVDQSIINNQNQSQNQQPQN
jgi:serine protease Do